MKNSPSLRHVDVAAGIIWRGTTILCCQRPAGRVQAGFLEFPGGKIRPGEDAAHALERELEEELGIRVLQSQPLCTFTHSYPEDGLEVHLHFFHVTAFAGEPRPREGQTLCWQAHDRAGELGFLAANRDLVRTLRPPQPSESLTGDTVS